MKTTTGSDKATYRRHEDALCTAARPCRQAKTTVLPQFLCTCYQKETTLMCPNCDITHPTLWTRPSSTIPGWDGAQGVTSAKALPQENATDSGTTPARSPCAPAVQDHPLTEAAPPPDPTVPKTSGPHLPEAARCPLRRHREEPPHPSLPSGAHSHGYCLLENFWRALQHHVAPGPSTETGVISPNFRHWEDLSPSCLPATRTPLLPCCPEPMWCSTEPSSLEDGFHYFLNLSSSSAVKHDVYFLQSGNAVACCSLPACLFPTSYLTAGCCYTTDIYSIPLLLCTQGISLFIL